VSSRRRKRTGERGSILVIVAAAMVAIFGLAALGTDIGVIFVERQRLSAAADAAALSGAQLLPGDVDGAVATAREVLAKNGIDPTRAEVTVAEDRRHLTVNLSRTVSMTFARVIGMTQVEVPGSATVEVANLSGYSGAAPLGVPRADWQIGEQVYLKVDPDEGSISPGNYQALALGKNGASAYEQNLMYGYDGWIRIGDWLDTEPGNMAGPTARAVRYRISQDPDSTYLTVKRNSPRLIVVPILEDFNVNGKGQVHVVGFGLFFLENAYDSGKNKGQVVGRFLRFYTEGEGSLSAPDFGAYTTKLIR
jgi:Flp pilus assembly protein TadG